MNHQSPIEAPHTYPGDTVNQHCTITPDGVTPSWSGNFNTEQQPTHAVLAIGSNGSPDQIRRKLRDLTDWTIPVAMVDVSHLTVAFSAHTAAAGYLPWAPVRHNRLIGVRRTPMLLLTEDLAAAMDATEPNYRRTPITTGPRGCRVHIAPELAGTRDVLERMSPALFDFDVEVYHSVHGVVCDKLGNPIPARDQQYALRLLSDRLGEDVTHAALSERASVYDRAAVALAAMSGPDGFELV